MRTSSTIILLLLIANFILAGCDLQAKPMDLSASVVTTALDNQAAGQDTAGFQRAMEPGPLTFPQDFGPHPNYQTEWWYYTGNLDDQDGRHFGYQLTFFRRALLPADKIPARASDWATSQVYMVHFALTDVNGQRYQAVEGLSRGAAGLAGAQSDPYQVWLQDWQVTAAGPDSYKLQAQATGTDGLPFALDLALLDLKGPILQGDQGFSKKGPESGQASFYFSQTRLKTSGSVQVGDHGYNVLGYSWMDHEYSTSALSEDQIGWDWFAIQFEPIQSEQADQMNELMVFQIRRADGSTDPFSSGTLIDPQGNTRSLQKDQFQIEVLGSWQSPHSGAIYPAGWSVHVPEANLNLTITPYLADQELNVSYAYWEGAVKINGSFAGIPVTGSGYVELTGYSGSMGGEF
jgi:predicted secreted hydrolase